MTSTTFIFTLYYPTLLEIGLFYLFSYLLMEILKLSTYHYTTTYIGVGKRRYLSNYNPIYRVFMPWKNTKGIWMGLFVLIIYPFTMGVLIHEWFRKN